MNNLACVLVIGLSFCAAWAPAAPSITLSDLLKQMVDLDALSVKPLPGERCEQASSYDRASRIVDGKKADWFANGDAGHYIRIEERDGRREMVMADVRGPGAMVRIWSANPKGILRVYLDGAEKPVIESEFAKLFDGSLGYPFIPPFAGVRSSGANLYFPIPFAQRLLVTVEGGEGMYYHVNYRLYPPQTQVERFSWQAVERTRPVGEQVAKRLAKPYETWRAPSGSQTHSIRWSIPPNGSRALNLRGPARIVAIEMKPGAKDLQKALRTAVLEITWDNAASPSVWSPLGDFFGTGPGLNPFQALPCGVLENGTMYSHWVMPFARQAVLRVRNEGDEALNLSGKVVVQPIRWSSSLLYFHAQWHTKYPISTRPMRDWTMVKAQGTGRFVGVALSVANPVKAWWGEGDEKFYVDDEQFPSTFGTGSEDYFGYAWCNPARFTHAYHNQPRADGPANYGHVSNNRFHLIDNIPFQKGFRGDIEIWHWAEARVSYSAIGYWYGDRLSGVEDPPTVKQRLPVTLPDWPAFREPDAIEGEKVAILRRTGGNVTTQDMEGFGEAWSGASQLWWTGAQPGDVLELGFDVENAGTYELIVAMTKAVDYGQFRLSVNDTPVGDVIDLFNNGVIHTGKISLGRVTLKQGQNVLRVEVVGTNPASTGDRYMFGLDFIKIAPVP
ncbi:MAG: DUF2961 domain-containing protein [Armatimonadota bacterium]|nr:DUF2961 domain-containing protein [bacterium]MDW8322159.1 DUF2961 domain-containing protein [Armatimonadota bacterium]